MLSKEAAAIMVIALAKVSSMEEVILFHQIICAEDFSALLRKAEDQHQLSGVALNRYSPRISHPLFADDSLLFAKATQNEAEKIMEIFYLYEQASKQKLNLEKSDIFFSKNVPEAE
ncbi:hypothetical protein Acr_00g0101730 [Actinidia rufa]|uniref:Reverse transcriptase domain-containing protein n=1 Tax=Actinidia rufa TaxID=165716 RepID=A0A7J0E0E2_9ERIC|nr:hypothetical protein Acr_00g0101730 [Actinidia rufa]